MAQYKVTRCCGHEEYAVLFGKMKDREWRLEHYEPTKLCHECFLAQREKEREAEHEAAVRESEGLPQLEGTEKQVHWAETLRVKMIEYLEEQAGKYRERRPEDYNLMVEYTQHILESQNQARWWIDNRDYSYSYFLDVAKKWQESLVNEPTTAEKEAIEEIAEQTTIRPDTAKTETVAEIETIDNKVIIRFPEKREDFRKLMRSNRFEWVGKWQRTINIQAGTVQDRAAEIARKMLANGFIVRLSDDDIRDKAISNNIEPEYTRWIFERATGDYAGWFVIKWDRDREDFYNVSRKLPRSRWDKGTAVPHEFFEEVLDFAAMYDFKFTETAKKAIEKARATKEAAMVVNVEKEPKRVKFEAGTTPKKLDVPQEVDIDESLRDDD